MLFKMIRGVLFHQRGKMLLIAFTIALGASLATGMLNVMFDVGDKVNQELKTYGANIVVKPKDSSLLSDIYDVGEGDQLSASWLNEEDLPKLKMPAQRRDRQERTVTLSYCIRLMSTAELTRASDMRVCSRSEII